MPLSYRGYTPYYLNFSYLKFDFLEAPYSFKALISCRHHLCSYDLFFANNYKAINYLIIEQFLIDFYLKMGVKKGL